MTLHNSKILITGGFGALGLNLIQYLQSTYTCEIHVVDNLSAGISNVNVPNVIFSYLDISNTEKINSFFENYKPHYIFHLAAHFANQNSVDHPISDVNTNIIGIINILETQKRNPELKKFIYASSSCVYGNALLMNENDSITPYDTPYAINKYAGELYCKYYSEIQKIPSVVIRIFNSFGPGEMPGSYRNVIPNFIKKALDNEPIFITGSGEETRDFTYVLDTVSLLVKLAESDYSKAEIFNGGTGNSITIKHLAETIIKYTGSNSEIVYTKPRNWDKVNHRKSDTSKSVSLLGYQPDYNFEKGIINTVAWIKQHLKPED
ncbi:NAD-dependent epimerase/dehydratase family protein [Flavobacterium aciduliphilum]|uniref:Nucleoside-diphosphate-sugar epimerase n=1 Tax=Flavobacterium aciduliphilum TaxID=1101402 RepID=A0A328Y8W8_9FLAO|nr:NAD-dependent epimerase/dehydratase family protein [Flavobacterium aciduliphilum]RAR69297.1 nucleoside-diphosphate-sugar epimerase [Flavobacterium aciduliphilum]